MSMDMLAWVAIILLVISLQLLGAWIIWPKHFKPLFGGILGCIVGMLVVLVLIVAVHVRGGG